MRRASPDSHATSSSAHDATDAVFQQYLDALCDDLSSPLSPVAWQVVHQALAAARTDPCGDGDQSPLPARVFHPMRKAWATGLDARDAVLKKHCSNSVHRCAWEADVRSVQRLIHRARERQNRGHQLALTHLLEQRLSNLRLSPLHYVCFSARSRPIISEQMASDYVDVVHALCRAGARLDSRDIAGYTPLSIASSFICNPTTLRIARILVSYGADPNARTRFGEHIITSSIIGGNKDAFRTLLRAGADLSRPDRSGVSPRDLSSKRPEFEAIVAETEHELNSSRMVCDLCGEADVTKLCGACRSVSYCSRQCQKDAWRSGHKERCATTSCVAAKKDIASDIRSDGAVPGL